METPKNEQMSHSTYSIAQAQRLNAAYYREQARHAPWNSHTRREWLQLAQSAENSARHAEENPYIYGAQHQAPH